MDLRADPYLHRVLQRIRSVLGEELQALIVFGSCARGEMHLASDIDLLALIEPASGTLSNEAMADASKQCALALGDAGTPVEVWVRTPTQFDEARAVFGGVEFFAARDGVELFSRPRREPVSASTVTPSQVRDRNVRLAVEEARRLLGLAIIQESGAQIPAYVPPSAANDVFAWRSIQRALLAVFIWRGDPSQRKSDDLPATLAKLRPAHPAFIDRVHRATAAGLNARSARDVLVLVAGYLARDPAHRAGLKRLEKHLRQP